MTQSSEGGIHRLIKAVKRGDVAVIESLVESGVDVNGYNAQGLTPLCVAAGKGDTQVLRALLHAGAEPNKLSLTGFAPLSLAQSAKQRKAAELLREAGAKREEVDPFARHLKTIGSVAATAPSYNPPSSSAGTIMEPAS